MQCKVEGCGRTAAYKAAELCQKHYFRVRRNGATDIVRTQAKHERANAVAVTVDGITKTAAEWAREPGVTVGASGLIWRIRRGWDPKRAVYQKARLL